MKRRHAHSLRRRYGRGRGRGYSHGCSLGPQAITRPVGRGLYEVVVVDRHGNVLRKLAHRVPYRNALAIVLRRHG
jgi:hypothetical protein